MARYPSQQPEYRKQKYQERKESLNEGRRSRYQADAEYREKVKWENRVRRRQQIEKWREHDRQRSSKTLVMRAKVAIGRCMRCGYDAHVGALQWAHRDASEKLCEPSKLRRVTDDDTAYSELRKCVLLCANCHWENTHGLWAIPKSMQMLCQKKIRRVMKDAS